MDKLKILTIYCTIFLVLTISSYAEITTLTYEDSNSKKYAFSFEDGNFKEFESQGDVYFVGLEDKSGGHEKPYLYIENQNGRITLKEENKKCSELGDEDYSEREQAIEVGKEYCVRTQSGNNYVNVKVLELADDWSSVKIEWSLEKDTLKMDITSIYILISLVLLVLIISVIIKLKKYS